MEIECDIEQNFDFCLAPSIFNIGPVEIGN